MKILYAAGNNFHSRVQLERFLKHVPSGCQLKVAAYKKSLPSSGADWILDPLLFPKKDGHFQFLENRYLQVYMDQVKSFDPDLVISDFEIYTSYVASVLTKKLWHVSGRLFNFAIDFLFKKHINIHTYYKSLYENHVVYSIINDVVASADKNYVYSHFCDIDEKLPLKNNFNWMRPYYQAGKKSEAARHTYVTVNYGSLDNISYLSDKIGDKVIFSNDKQYYDGFILKNFSDLEEYSCNLGSCDYYVSDGTASFSADAFYNQRKSIVIQNYSSLESLFNYMIHHQVYRYLVEDDVILPSIITVDNEVKFLHERIEELL